MRYHDMTKAAGINSGGLSFAKPSSSMEFQRRLLLRFEDDGDGTGKILVQAVSGGFSGESGAWFSISELQDSPKPTTA